MNLSRLFSPTSIAVVGATDRIGSYGYTAVANLVEARFAGRLIGVNPRRSDVLGVPCVPTLDEAGPVDAVVIATPADTVPDLLSTAGELGCGGAVVFAADFAETGRTDRQDLLVSAASAHNLPVIGPNANGVVSVPSRAPMWGDGVTLSEAGGVALITQSGNLGVVALASRRGIAWHTVVSVGNSAVVDAAMALQQLAVTDGVRSVALYLEGDGDGRSWAEAFALCAENDVRLAILKAGRSEAGAAAGGAHTAAVAGDHRIFSSLVAEAGGAWCHDPHELLETAKLLATPRPTRTGGLAAVTCSGGDSVITADEADRLGVPLAVLAPETERALADVLPEGVVITNPLDHTNMLWAETDKVRALCEILAADPSVSQVLYVQDTPPDLTPDAASEWKATRDGLVQADIPGTGRAVASGLPELMPEAVAADLAASGVTALGGIPTALSALKAHALTSRSPARLREIAASVAFRTPGEWLAEHAGKELLASYGVPVPVGVSVRDGAEAVAAAASLNGPVAMKISHADVQHKSDVGGVLLGLTEPERIEVAAEQLLSLAPDGVVLVEEMAEPGMELIVSATRDGVVPSLVIGTGGIWTELLRDVVVVPLPADPSRVAEALRTLRSWPMLSGGRGQAKLAVDELCQLASAAGDALLAEPLTLVELNPVIVSTNAAVAVDAVVRR
ncbi:MAG TPA: acetate--CoA ligase family protein [Actinomycetes bacterium]|nr:acetate--CoA ligase family protein [Actinomycetes bacterium]